MGKIVKLLRGTNEKLSDSNVRLNFGDGQVVYDTTNEELNFFMNQDGVLTRFGIEDSDLPAVGEEVSLGGSSAPAGALKILFWSYSSTLYFQGNPWQSVPGVPAIPALGSNHHGNIMYTMEQLNIEVASSEGSPYSVDTEWSVLHGNDYVSDYSSAVAAAISGEPYVNSNSGNDLKGGPYDVVIRYSENADHQNDASNLFRNYLINNQIPIIEFVFNHTAWGLSYAPLPTVADENPPYGTINYKLSYSGGYQSHNSQMFFIDEEFLNGQESFTKGIPQGTGDPLDKKFMWMGVVNAALVPVQNTTHGVDLWGVYSEANGAFGGGMLTYVKYKPVSYADNIMRRVDINASPSNGYWATYNSDYSSTNMIPRLLLNAIHWCAGRLPDPPDATIN